MSSDDARKLRKLDPVRNVAVAPLQSRVGVIPVGAKGRFDRFEYHDGMPVVWVWFGGIHGIVKCTPWELEMA